MEHNDIIITHIHSIDTASNLLRNILSNENISNTSKRNFFLLISNLLKRIIIDSNDERLRKINMNKESYILKINPIANAFDFLLSIGFVTSNNWLLLQNIDIHYLQSIISLLDKALSDINLSHSEIRLSKDQIGIQLVEMGFDPKAVSLVVKSCFNLDRCISILSAADPELKVLSKMIEEEKKKKELEEKLSNEAIQRMVSEDNKALERQKKRLEEIEKADKNYLRKVLLEDVMMGKPISLVDSNFLILRNYSPSSRYSCDVCYDDDLLLEQIAVLDCSHYLCIDCMRRHLSINIKNGRSIDLQCFHEECKNRVIKYNEVKRIVASDILERYTNALLQNHLATDVNCRYCPRPQCGNAMIGDPNHPMMVCSNERCKFTFCFNCKIEWHSDVTCQNYQKWLEENKNAESRFEDWVKQNTKKCPNCHSNIQKNGGCNHMTCVSCRYEFCWLCLGHYNGSHFSKGKCKGKQFT